jgi:hypothetical protein
MHQELNELKKIIIKVQTFSMETNLDVLKIKKTMKLNESTDSNESKLVESDETKEFLGLAENIA